MPTIIIDQKKCEVNIHGGKQAFAVNEGDCTSCMSCVDACPEKAIQIIP